MSTQRRQITQTAPWLWGLLLCLALAGCEKGLRDMYNQPKHPPYGASELFADGQSARPPPEGIVAHATGPLAGTSSGRTGVVTPAPRVGPALPTVAAQGPLGDKAWALERGALPAANPLPLTDTLLRRGRQRYDIYCAPCHGLLGDGDGILPRRGFPAPPSYHSERLRQAPDSHFYAVITHGYGVMYSYAARVAPDDRWAVVAYIRSLQYSQYRRLGDVPPEARKRLMGGAP